jgi:hypothetical protein
MSSMIVMRSILKGFQGEQIMSPWVLAGLIYYLRREKKWSWGKIGRTAIVGIAYLTVASVITCFLPESA